MPVKQSDIDEIRKLGMARALKKASTDPNASDSFKEGVKRFYPKAQFGPKTAAKIEAEDSRTPVGNIGSPKKTFAGPPTPQQTNAVNKVTTMVTGVPAKKSVQSAAKRKLAGPPNPNLKSTKSSTNDVRQEKYAAKLRQTRYSGAKGQTSKNIAGNIQKAVNDNKKLKGLFSGKSRADSYKEAAARRRVAKK